MASLTGTQAFEWAKTRQPVIRRATIAQYAKIANPIDPEEAVSFELYAPPSEPEEKESSSGERMGV